MLGNTHEIKPVIDSPSYHFSLSKLLQLLLTFLQNFKQAELVMDNALRQPFRCSFLWLCLFAISTVSIAQDLQQQSLNAQQILQEMSQAMRTLNYRGTLALFRNGHLNTMRFYHAANGGEEQERLLALNTPLMEAIRTPSLVKCYYPDSKKIVVDHRPSRRSFLMDLPENFAESQHAYDFIFAKPEVVARLPALVVKIKPKDDFRYARKVWISKDHYLPLRFELTDDFGDILEQLVFTELHVVNSLPLIQIPLETKHVQHIHQLDFLDFDQASFTLEGMPKGFKKVSFTKQHFHGSNKLIDHLLLSDGFASVSIYLEEGENGNKSEPAAEHQAIGAVNIYTDRLKNYQLTVMGEVPVKTLEYIAANVRLRKQIDSSAKAALDKP